MHITASEANEDIPNSPYMVPVVVAPIQFDPRAVHAEGPGLSPTGVQPNQNADFTVDARGVPSGVKAPLGVTCYDASTGTSVPVQATDNKDATTWCRYIPKHPGKHVVYVTYGGVNIHSSPFRVHVHLELLTEISLLHVLSWN